MTPSLIPTNNTHLGFWLRHPGLLVGLTFLIGVSTLFGSLFWALYLGWLRKWPQLLLLPLSFFYAASLSPPQHINSTTKAIFSIHSLQPHNSPFHKGLQYKGTLYLPEGPIACCIYTQKHHPANTDYLLTGTLSSHGFKPKEWVPLPNTWSLAEFRYQMKERLKTFLHEKLSTPRAATLLSSLLTGDVEDRSLRYEFGRLGLQHILAISGFHFGLLIAFCSFFLTLFLPEKPKLIFLLICITLYFLFIGPSPAVQRSWIAATLYLLAPLLNRRTNGLNLLGVALAIEVLLDPFVYSNIGFQLSFLSCGGILLFHPLIEKSLRPLLPKRDAFQIMHLSLLYKHLHLASATLRQTLSLGLSVNLALFPLLLYHFHQFPFLSLLYNLFFPFLISLSLFALLISFALPFLFPLTNWFTAQILTLAAYPPLALDYVIAIKNIPYWTIPIYLFALFLFTIHINHKNK